MSLNGARQSRAKSRAVWTVLFVLWLCVVWGHSLAPGAMSQGESDYFVEWLMTLIPGGDATLLSPIVRKGAHFTEYAILGAIIVGMSRAWFENSALAMRLSLVLWVAVPSIDESIQLFVPGREGMITDVLIDMSGGLLGMLIMRYVQYGRARKRGGQDDMTADA